MEHGAPHPNLMRMKPMSARSWRLTLALTLAVAVLTPSVAPAQSATQPGSPTQSSSSETLARPRAGPAARSRWSRRGCAHAEEVVSAESNRRSLHRHTVAVSQAHLALREGDLEPHVAK